MRAHCDSGDVKPAVNRLIVASNNPPLNEREARIVNQTTVHTKVIVVSKRPQNSLWYCANSGLYTRTIWDHCGYSLADGLCHLIRHCRL